MQREGVIGIFTAKIDDVTERAAVISGVETWGGGRVPPGGVESVIGFLASN